MYIRTKDRIYEVIEENSNYYKCCYDNGRITLVAKFDNDVNGFSKALKQANTIEELVDGFYLDIDNHPFDSTQIYDEILEATKEKEEWQSYSDRKELSYKIDLYAFIKTSKGLIYVAKLNEDGELELI